MSRKLHKCRSKFLTQETDNHVMKLSKRSVAAWMTVVWLLTLRTIAIAADRLLRDINTIHVTEEMQKEMNTTTTQHHHHQFLLRMVHFLWQSMIMGAAGSTVYYNLRLRHPTIDIPLIDYDLALLFQPMLMLGISIGVAFNVIFADWMVTVLLIILFVGTSTKALCKGIETWKKETMMMQNEAAKQLEAETDDGEEDYKRLPSGPQAVHDDQNIYWKELALLIYVWVGFLLVQIVKIPIAVSVTVFEAMCLCKGTRVIASKGKQVTNWKLYQILAYCSCGIVAGMVGGLLGLGAAYFVVVATMAALVGQHVVRKIIGVVGRASIIIFILALTIFISAVSLGGVGILNMVEKLERNEYMGFDSFCPNL
ncbi:Sulfite exporter TauE/SafE family protein 3 [Linum perenne]